MSKRQRFRKSTSDHLDQFTELVGRKTWTLVSHPCTGKWRGTTDYGIQFEDGFRYFVSNGMTYFEEKISDAIMEINTVQKNREQYLQILRVQAQHDNLVAASEGLLPVKVISVEMNFKSGNYFLWPYAMLEVNGIRFKFIETGMCYAMKEDRMDRWVERYKKPLFTAGAVQHPDHIFGNVRHSSTEDLYRIK